MNFLTSPTFLRNWILCIVALFGTMAVGGCGTTIAHLEISPNTGQTPVVQDFPHAYLAVGEDGDDDIALVSEGLIPSQTRGHVLEPSQIDPLKQIVHIHVLWRPLPGTRADQPTSTNAIIDWYVLSNMPDSSDDRLVYRGAGFITIYPTKRGAHIVIRSASMSISQKTGDLVDPFGPASLAGAFDVIRNDGMAHDVIASATAPPPAPPILTTQPSAPDVPAPTLPQLQ
jgi:hypothetical protein